MVLRLKIKFYYIIMYYNFIIFFKTVADRFSTIKMQDESVKYINIFITLRLSMKLNLAFFQ